jgi:ATP phosphoribosyltransferase
VDKELKIALPKGRLLVGTAELLDRAGWGLGDYHDKTRCYRIRSQKYPDLLMKVFQERDIPIQVAVGNYDFGICGLDWAEELLARYPNSALVKVKELGFGSGALYATMAKNGTANDIGELAKREANIRIASEYPNLAESFAERIRLRRFSIYPLWGAAEVYPPESADLVLLPVKTGSRLLAPGLTPIAKVLDYGAYLVANKNSLKSKDMADMLASLIDKLPLAGEVSSPADIEQVSEIAEVYGFGTVDSDTVRLALPDGHQQAHVRCILDKAGVKIEDYPSAEGNRRPISSLEGVAIKVIRPQDMPLQVASGNFDLAITGRDWLTEHLEQFPPSPVREILNLKYGRVKIVAVVSQEVADNDIDSLKKVCRKRSMPYRVASEYVNIADRYARDNHLGRYRVIPTWGASEAFLPEDADLLIENTETGGTIARHNLKIIDTLFESTACLIGGATGVSNPIKSKRISYIIEMLRKAVEGN